MSKSTIRGPVGRASTTLVPPIGRPVGHVPTATDGHTGLFRALIIIGRLVWRFRRELAVTIVQVLLLGWLSHVLAPVAATSVWLALIGAVLALDCRHRLVGGWLARGRLRRRWDRACRMLWLNNLNDHTPRIRRLSTVPAGHRLDVAVPAAVGMADLERNADTLAAGRHETGECVGARAGRHRRGRPTGHDHLPYRNVLVGGEPGGGKSVAVSQLLAVAALDPTTDQWLLDGKRVELGVWRDAARAFVDTSLDDAIDVLHRLQAVIDQRLDWLDAQPGVRRKIIRIDERRVQVVVCDEYAFYTTTGDRRQVKEFEAAFTDLVARGRAVGVVTILATQKPHSDVISTGLRDLFAFRWALRCTTPQASDTVLGQGWASRGYSAADLDPACSGVGWLLHERGLPVRCRTHYLDDDQVEQLAARVIVLRRASRRAQSRAGDRLDLGAVHDRADDVVVLVDDDQWVRNLTGPAPLAALIRVDRDLQELTDLLIQFLGGLVDLAADTANR
jgi:hypothetical protein